MVALGKSGASDCLTTNGPAKLPQQYAVLERFRISACRPAQDLNVKVTYKTMALANDR